MPRELTVLERLRAGRPDTPTATESVEDRIKSVVANVRRLINSRVGGSAAAPDYGMLPPSEIVHAFPHAIERVQRQLRTLIDRYEPRLSDVEILHLEVENEPIKLFFQLSGRIPTSSGGTWLTLRLVFHPSGRFDVRR